MKSIWASLQFKIPTVFVVAFVLVFTAIFAVFATIGKTLLEKQAYKQVTLSAEKIVSQLGNRIAFAESLAMSLANLGEILPPDVEQNRLVFKGVLGVEGSEAFIAGGGIWPAPFKYAPDVERRSFFWGRDKNGVLQYYDNYNDPSGPGYHHEEWYVPAKHLPPGKPFWSKSYMDPYSYQPMVTVTVPMYKQNKFYGVSTVDLKLEGLRNILEKAAASFGGYAFAVDRNGKFLSFPDESYTKIYSQDAMGGRTEDFITVHALTEKLPGFKPLADNVLETISSPVVRTTRAGLYDPVLAENIDKDSYQIDAHEAKLIAAMLAEAGKPLKTSSPGFRELYLEQDSILKEPAYAAVFDMPDTYWKIITVMPYSKAIEASNVIYRNLVISISIAMFISLAIMLFAVRRILVRPISHMSNQLQSLTEDDRSVNKLLETSDKGELGTLAYWFNQRSNKLLEVQNELLDAHNELEKRVQDRTEKLRVEIKNRIQQQSEKEKWADRVERQHAAVVSLSLHQSLFNGDITEAAKIINETASKVLNVTRSSIWLFDESGEKMEAIDIYDKLTNYHRSDIALRLEDHPAYFEALASERAIAVYDMLDDARTVDLVEYARTYGITSLLDCPIRVAGELRGVICFEHVGDNRRWHNDEIRFGGEVADQFHQVLTNAERIQSDDQIRKLAFFDPLTDLANRRFLQETLQHEIDVANRQGKYGSLLYLDLDNFKTLNDSLGHGVGDELLVQLSIRLKNTLRKEDMAARLGGDEFVVLLTGEHASKDTAMEQALSVARKIQAAISKPYRLHGYEHIITASIGITLYPDPDTTVTDILKQADTAMYRAKDDGRNTITFYNSEFQRAADKRLLLEKELRTAIANEQFEMYYQPQIDASGKLAGAEALVRWVHPHKGVVSPADFIPIAEDTGLILELGNWILRDTCTFSKSAGLDCISINISPRQFRQADFVQTVTDIIRATGADPHALMFELTEGIVIDNIADTIDKMHMLKKLGIRFAIDDFGTGYSSLAYLKQLPLDQLKINDKFIRDVTTNTNDAIILETIILMARHLDLKVVAEGVERTDQLDFLSEKNCQLFQGHLFSKPLCKADFAYYSKVVHLPRLPKTRS